jgi:hypothetical protein
LAWIGIARFFLDKSINEVYKLFWLAKDLEYERNDNLAG